MLSVCLVDELSCLLLVYKFGLRYLLWCYLMVYLMEFLYEIEIILAVWRFNLYSSLAKFILELLLDNVDKNFCVVVICWMFVRKVCIMNLECL